MPGQPVVLDTFGGMVASARPEDLPEGASPRCNDVDFIVGRFIQRPGAQSQYTIEQSEVGPEGGSSATDISLGLATWNNPSNILANDGSYATVSLSGPATNYAVQSIAVTFPGYYSLDQTPVATISGPGSGAVLSVQTQTVTPSSGPQYQIVTGVTVVYGGIFTGTATVAFSGASTGNDATGTVAMETAGSTQALSDVLRVTGFSLAVPSGSSVNGIFVNPKGLSPSATIYAQLVKNGSPVGAVESAQLYTTDQFVLIGGDTYLWNEAWANTDFESSEFGVNLWVGSSTAVTVSLDYVEIALYVAASPSNFNGIANANLNQTDQVTLILDANGLTWEEDVTNAPNQLSLQPLIPPAVPGSYLKGVDANGTVYMAYSDLTQGTSQPMQFNGQSCDRITQVGPGQAPVFTPITATGTSFPIATITQYAQSSTQFIEQLWSDGPGSTGTGNVATIYYANKANSSGDLNLINAFNAGNAVYVYVSNLIFTPANGTFRVTAIGEGTPVNEHGQTWYYFTYQIGQVGYGFNRQGTSGNYQMTVATLTATEPVPGLAVGNQITVTGNSNANYNAQWTITEALNSGEMGITSTSVSSGVATYQYALQTGSPPNAGELVTVTNTTNANGALNVTNAVIQSSSAFGGIVNTSGTSVTWVSGNNFSSLGIGEAITIGATGYTIQTVNSSTSITLTTSAGTQTSAVYSAGTENTGFFTVAVAASANYPAAPEAGSAATAGTVFAFDPGFLTLGTATDPIYGSGYGGSLIFQGPAVQVITPGVKQGSVFFITRNGAVTRPAPPVQFTVPQNCGSVLVSQIPVGPPNVVQRGITLTESGQNGVPGASFYTYDTAVTYYVNGIQYTSDALIVNDNTSTSATFAFSDSVLLASDEIDIPGNDYFNLAEIGSPVWIFQYANRMLYGLCQNKIQNFLNLSFDGGYLPVPIGSLPLPTGWTLNGSGNQGSYTVTGFSITSNVVTVQCSNSLQAAYNVLISGLSTGTYLNGVPLTVLTASSSQFTAAFAYENVSETADNGTVTVSTPSIGLVTSLDFGNAFRVMNLGASSWTEANILFQAAYQDYENVAIIEPNTPYSVRLKARAINADGQQATIQFATWSSGTFGSVIASFTGTFNQGPYQILTGSLLTQGQLPTVPSSMVITAGVANLAANAGIEIDRIEIYPMDNPVLTTTIWTSYAGNFEAVDINTGTLGVGTENPQPAVGAFELLEQLYIEKTGSMQITQDSPNYEPNDWQVRQTSDRAGAVGPNAFDEGEEFGLSASRNGIYFFDGGKPMPVMRELQSTAVGTNLWEKINWNAGKTIWLRNDLQNRRLYIGIPLITPNFWLPNAPASVPTQPNVILMCNYTGCPTGDELANSAEVHITMFGDLKALDMRRKWALWQFASPVAEFVPRQDGLSDPLFLCNGNSSQKAYQFVPGAAQGGQNTDDGAAINWSYATYGFTKAKQGQQIQGLGALRKIWYYLAATMEGVGQVAAKLYSNSLGALPQNTFTIPLPFTLSYPQQNDQERVLEIGGQKLFIEFSSLGSGGYAEVGPVILDGEMDKVSPHRGVSS